MIRVDVITSPLCLLHLNSLALDSFMPLLRPVGVQQMPFERVNAPQALANHTKSPGKTGQRTSGKQAATGKRHTDRGIEAPQLMRKEPFKQDITTIQASTHQPLIKAFPNGAINSFISSDRRCNRPPFCKTKSCAYLPPLPDFIGVHLSP